MRRADAEAILSAATGLTYGEWRSICELVEQEFAALHRQTRLTEEAARSAQRLVD